MVPILSSVRYSDARVLRGQNRVFIGNILLKSNIEKPLYCTFCEISLYPLNSMLLSHAPVRFGFIPVIVINHFETIPPLKFNVEILSLNESFIHWPQRPESLTCCEPLPRKGLSAKD